MDEKYIALLIEKCTNLKENPYLFIHYSQEITPFIQKLVKQLKKLGIKEIYLDNYDPDKVHTILKESTIEEIEQEKTFDCAIWDSYATRNACFLIFETEYPGLMDDISPQKIAVFSKKKRESKPIYRKLVETCQLSWCIAAYPGIRWAQKLFPDDPNSYDKLKQAIYQICMLEKPNPLKEWERYLEKNSQIMAKLNQLQLKHLHYSNQLGTDLNIYLPDNYRFSSAKDNEVIVNMPSYEVFTSPIFTKTEGIVYNSRPLIYNGAKIDHFFLKFKEGKVVDYDAKVGRNILKEIISSDSNSCYLGECALVEVDSPIAKMNVVFETTLIDENASCHLALGAGFPECIENGIGLTDRQLLNRGINVSNNHVDFMIGTPDLKIVGTTKTGMQILIFESGKFSSSLLASERFQ